MNRIITRTLLGAAVVLAVLPVAPAVAHVAPGDGTPAVTSPPPCVPGTGICQTVAPPATGTSAAMFGGSHDAALWYASRGKPLAYARQYALIGQQFSQPWLRSVMAQGSTVMASLDLAPGQTYAQVAAGTYDTQITSWLQGAEAAAAQYGLPSLWVAFEHEANGRAHHPASIGGPADFVAAWDHVHALADAAGLNVAQGGRLHWVLILTHRAYWPAKPHCPSCGLAAAFFPGPGETDAIGADGYNSMGCHHNGGSRAAVTPATLFDPALAFAAGVGLPVVIAEFGSFNPPPGTAQPAFLSAMRDYVVANPTVIAASAWWQVHPQPGICAYSPEQNPASVAALDSMQAALTGRP